VNVTSKQWFQIVSGFVSALITGAALLTTLFGPDLTPKIIAGLGVINMALSSVGVTLSGQGSLVKDVAAMPGVENITVNKNANQALAAIAVGDDINNVAPTPEAVNAVLNTAKGT